MNSTLPFEDALTPSRHQPSGWSTRPPRVGDAITVRVPTRRGEKAIEARDLSLTGVYLAGVRAAVGQVVPLRLSIPELDGELSIAGRVVRCDEQAPGVALTFSRIGWEDMFVIARFLAPRL